MNVDLENAICHGEEQRRKRYKKNNEYARVRVNIAKKTEELFYLFEIPLTEELNHHHEIQDLRRQVQIITSEENYVISEDLCQNHNVESNDNSCRSNVNDFIVNDEPSEQNNNFYISNFTDSPTSDEDSNEAITRFTYT